jgi:uncharacterized protein (TIRG00374 family)
MSAEKRQKIPTPVRYLLAFLISFGALYLAFHDQNWSELYGQMQQMNLWWIIAGTGCMFLSHLIRAWRWRLFLDPIKAGTRVSSGFMALMAGYAANNAVPRTSEVVRPVLFSKREKVPIPETVASIVIERLSDLFGLVLFLIISIFVFEDTFKKAYPNAIKDVLPITIGLVALLVLTIVVLVSEKRTVAIVSKITKRLPEKIRVKIEQGSIGFSKGLQALRGKALFPFLLGTFGIYLMYAMSMYVSFFAFPHQELSRIGFTGAVALQTLSGLAFTIPTPGGTGTYHFFISRALTNIFDVPSQTALAFATVVHASNYILTTIVGLGFILIEGISMKQLARKDKEMAKDEDEIVFQAIHPHTH